MISLNGTLWFSGRIVQDLRTGYYRTLVLNNLNLFDACTLKFSLNLFVPLVSLEANRDLRAAAAGA